MSSRALRKLQREEEERKRLEVSQKQDEISESEGEAPPSKPLNTFNMLNDQEEADDLDTESVGRYDSDVEPEHTLEKPSQAPKAKKVKRKKGKKKAAGAKHPPNAGESKDEPGLDEIDLALRSLSAQNKEDTNIPLGPTIDQANAQLYSLLAVESKHLNALNEMKRLFGNVVLENNEDGPAAHRRRGRGPQQVDLGGALAARNSPVSRGQGEFISKHIASFSELFTERKC